MPHYDLQSVLKDHNGNKRNYFLFFVLSLIHSNVNCLNVLYVLACILDIALVYHALLICDTEINQSILIKTEMLLYFQATGEQVSVFAFDVKNSSESQVYSLLYHAKLDQSMTKPTK